MEEPLSENEEEPETEEAENMVISGDVSRVLVIGTKLRPRSIRVTGIIYEAPVSVLIDGGSTHNFIKPAVAEKLSLSLHTISPFRVFVGNGASLRCDYVSLNTPISLQGHRFDIGLFLLQVEGPNVILGVQWLQDFGKVAIDFRDLSMEFKWKNLPILLQGEDISPKRISYNSSPSLVRIGNQKFLRLFPWTGNQRLTPPSKPLPLHPWTPHYRLLSMNLLGYLTPHRVSLLLDAGITGSICPLRANLSMCALIVIPISRRRRSSVKLRRCYLRA